MDGSLSLILIIVAVCLNLLALGTFAYDKYRAKSHGWRIPERSLLTCAVFGPFGALAGMVVFRHKIRHLKFLLVPFFALIQILLFFTLFAPLFR